VTAVFVSLLVLVALIVGLRALLRRVRAHHDELIAEHWRRNGKEWRRPNDW
jgi:hypothetical protein